MLREGQAMARITHPNVITVYEVGVEGELVFLAQELLDGGTLGEWLDEPRSQAEILEKFVARGARARRRARRRARAPRLQAATTCCSARTGASASPTSGSRARSGPEGDDTAAATRANMARASSEPTRAR